MAWHHLSRASAPLAPLVASLGNAAWPRDRYTCGSEQKALLSAGEQQRLIDSRFRPTRGAPSKYLQCGLFGSGTHPKTVDGAVKQHVLPLTREDIIKGNQKGSFSDQYETGKMLGEGSFGTVSLCKRRQSIGQFACKRIMKSSVKDYEIFINEVKILMELDHPHIIRLIEYFEEDTEVKLIFELCTGMDMFDKIVEILEDRDHFSAKETAFAMRQMIKSVIGCHSHRIIHHDIKPENFMIKDGKKEKSKGFMHVAIRLIDLGLSEHYVEGEKKQASLVGSVPYAAPEVFAGIYDEQCDVWSLGVILFLMIVGEPLFSLTDPPKKVSFEIQNKEFVPKALKHITKSSHPWISDDAKDLMTKMLEYDPSKRITLKEAAKHPFILDAEDKETHSMRASSGEAYDLAMSQKLERFARMPALKRAALLIMSHMAADSDTRLQRRTFRSMDVDFDGQVSKQEIEDWFTVHKSESLQLPAMWDTVFKQLDVMGTGHVHYCEFLAGMLPSTIYLQEQTMAQAFNLLDTSHDGKVDEDDLLTLVHSRVSRMVIQEIIADASPEGKSYLMYDDFKKMMMRDEE